MSLMKLREMKRSMTQTTNNQPHNPTEEITMERNVHQKPTVITMTDADNEPVIISGYTLVISRNKVHEKSPINSQIRVDGIQSVLVRETLEEIADQMGICLGRDSVMGPNSQQ